jgi:hypothetical protein
MAYLGKTPSQAVRSRYYYTATGGETSLSGADDNSNVLTFTDGNYVDVSLNGATLVAGSDYNTTTTNTIGGLAALTASDIVEVLVYDTFSVFGGNMAADLNFKDNVKANFGTGNDLQIFHDGSNSIIRDAGTGSLKFQYGTSDGVVFDSSGNVGIGQSNPTYLLKVGPINTTETIAVQSAGGGAETIMQSVSGSDSRIGSSANTPLNLITNNVSRVTIDTSGNLLVGGTSQSGTANRAAIFSANKFGLSVIDTTSFATNVGGALNLGGNYRTAGDAQAFCRVEALKENATDANFAYGMAFSTTPNGGTFTERMRIDSSGNVGIGTSSPSSYGRLAVMTPTATFGYFGIGNSVGGGGGVNIGSYYGTTKISYIDTVLEDGTPSSEQARLQFATISGGTLTERMRIDNGGNVQLGSASSVTGGRYFDIYNTGSTATDFSILRLITQQVGSSSATTVDIYKRKNGQFTIANNETNSDAFTSFNVGASERLRITSTGKIETGGRDYGFINHGTQVTLADDASIVINANEAGAGYLTVYHRPSGQWCNFGVGYNGATIMSALNSANFDVADTDGRFCVIATGHTITLKNRFGSSAGFFINFVMAGNDFAG